MGSASTTTDPTDRGRFWRTPVVALLVLLAVLTAPLSVVARYVDRELTDTDSYLETVGPLATNPVVQKAIARRVTSEILAFLKVEDLTDEALDRLSDRSVPPVVVDSLRALSVPLHDTVTTYVQDTVTEVVESDQFADAWIEANRVAHTQMVAVITGEGSDQVDVDQGAVSVNLAAVIATVKQALLDQGFERADRIPEVSAEFVVFQSADLVKVQRLTRALDRAATALPLVGLLLLAVALALSRRRRRVLVVASLGVATTMLLIGVGLALARSAYLDAIPVRKEGIAAATEVFDTIVHLLRQQVRAVLVVSLAVAVVAWSTRPGGWLRALVSWARDGRDAGRVGALARAHLVPLRVVVLAAVPTWYVVADSPSAGQVVTAAAAAAVAWVVLEVLARRAPADTATGSGALAS